MGAIRDRAAALDLPNAELAVGGPGGLIVDLVEVFASIDSFLLIVTVLLVLVLLILIYRSPIVALIPLLGVGLVFQLAGAVGAWVAQQFDLPISGQTTGIMTVVLFGTGTDYVLFVSARFREELTRHDDKHEAMRRTMRGVGGAVASAGATILIASAALMFATLRSYQTLGPVIAIAVGLMVLAALTLIPAVLTIGGRRAFWPMQPRLNLEAAAQPEGPQDWRRSIYGRIGGVVLRWPRASLAATTAALALLIAGLFAFQPNYDQLASLPDNTESVRSFELLRSGFPAGELSPTRVYVSLPPGEQALDPKRLEQLDSLTLALAGHPAVARAAGPSRPFGTGRPEGGPPSARARFVSADGGTARIDVVLTGEPLRDRIARRRSGAAQAGTGGRGRGRPRSGRRAGRRRQRRGGRYADGGGSRLTGRPAADPAGDRRRAGAAAAFADRAPLPDGDDRVHLLRHARPRGHRSSSCCSGTRASGPVCRSSSSSS